MTSMDMSQYIGAFLDEATEQLQNLNDLLLSLENDPQSEEIVTDIFRIAHTLKGMSATMGFEKIAHLTHAMEDMFDLVRKREIDLAEEDVTLLFSCLDLLTTGVESIREGGGESHLDIAFLVDKIHTRISGTPLEEPPHDAEENAQIPLTDQEKEWVLKAHSEGLEMYKIVVYLDDTCLLKAARAYMALARAGDMGDVIKTVPSVEDLEQESFQQGFVLYLATIVSEKEVQEGLERISEVKKVLVEQISDLEVAGDMSEESLRPASAEDLEASMDLEEELAGEQPVPQNRNHLPGAGKTPTDQPKRPAATGGRTVRVDIGRLDKLMNLVGELVIGRARIERLAMEAKIKAFDEPLSQLGRISGEIQELVTKLRMVPVSFVFDRFPRIVRDLSKNMGKEIDLVIEGKETELDRTVIDEIGDPMVHLIRNAVDHGVETPEERKKAQKPKQGTVFIAAYQEGNGVIIEVRDDGKGIDTKVVRKKAVERGMLTPEEAAALTEEEAIRLVFLPGFSTAQEVTDVSGRGVGMDAVKNKVESLGGQFQVESAVGKGTRVLIRLPLTLAIVLALLIRVGEETYAISLENVEETLLVQKDEIKYVHGTPVTNVRGEILSLKKLSTILRGENKNDDAQEYPVVVVKLGRNRVGFIVDELVGQQEIVIKPLGKLLSKVRGVAGATILGDGNVALILDVASFHAVRQEEELHIPDFFLFGGTLMGWGEITSLQLDAIREVGNIGTGNAATALSQMTGRTVDIGVPEAKIVPIYEIAEQYGSPEDLVCAVLIRTEGDLPCNFIFLIREEDSRSLADLLIPMDISSMDEEMQAQMRESALAEVGNIVLGAFLNAISMLTGYVLPASVPSVAHDMLGAIMDVVASMFGILGDAALLVKTSLRVKDMDNEVGGSVIMVPDPGALESLLQRLGVQRLADTIHVGMADLVAVKKTGILVTLGLGSCIGLVLFDQQNKIAGMAHIMLPDSRESASVVKPGKFADTAVPRLLDEMKALGASKSGIKAKFAGGAQMFNIPGKASSFLAVGARNAEATKEWLKKHGITVVAEDTGGSKGRSVEFNLATCMLTVKTLGMGTKEI